MTRMIKLFAIEKKEWTAGISRDGLALARGFIREINYEWDLTLLG